MKGVRYMRDRFVGWSLAALLCSPLAYGQFGRGQGDWSTAGADAARSSWVRSDAKISVASLQKPGFAFLWKVKADGNPTVPAILTGYIGYRGFRSLGYLGGGSGKITALDTDLGRIEWQKQVGTAAAQNGGAACPGGMTANVSRMVPAAIPSAPGPGGGGRGRGGAAKSAVGEPDEGSVIIAQVASASAGRGGGPGRPAAPPPALPGGRGAAGRGAGRGPGGGGGFVRQPNYIYSISSDGMLHSMYVSNGEEPQPAIPFLPANANAQGLIVVDAVAYTATSHACGGAPNAVWALDVATKDVASWKPASGDIAGTNGPAIAPDETVFVTTTAGDLVALEGKTLKVKGTYAAGSEFTSSPLIFESKDKVVVAATTKDGRLHLVDSENLAAPLATAQAAAPGTVFAPGALASWQDPAGTRWILASSSASVVAWKVTDQGVEPGWISGAMVAPAPPLIINGVVFALSTGNARTPAVLYALDSATGKELWNSGKTMTAHAQGGAFSGGGTQVYVATHEGTLYTFGFPMEH
jgi:outer membrane protein assembly factor BamB